MKVSLTEPNFEIGSFSERCLAFFNESHSWEDLDNLSTPNLKRRTVTWAHYPYRYWLEQNGSESRNVLRKTSIRHRMFEVALLSAARNLDGLRELERWYIMQAEGYPEQIVHFSHIVGEAEVEKVSGEMDKNFTFSLDNNLYQPNSEDLLKLDLMLKLGALDGFEPYNYANK